MTANCLLGPNARRALDAGARTLLEHGSDPTFARRASIAVAQLVIGSALLDAAARRGSARRASSGRLLCALASDESPPGVGAVELCERDQNFEFALRCLLDGVEARLGR